MLQQILTGQADGSFLLALAAFLFVFFLPSVVAFVRGQRHFLWIMGLNVLMSFLPAQASILYWIAPGMLTIDPHHLVSLAYVAAAATLNLGWIALMVWALWPGEPDPRVLKMQETKVYDFITALPLIIWFAFGALRLRAVLAYDWSLIAAGTAALYNWVQFFAITAAAAFDLLLVYVLAVRDRPVAKSQGILPRAFGVIGTFAGVGILRLPVAHLNLPMQIFAAVLIGVGSLGSLLVLSKLGTNFSILPEARKLVTSGPYALVRHPLYTVEIITIIGTAIQFQAPRSWLIALVVVTLLWIRSHFEEQVLARAYPEYGEYRARTKRFIPGII